MTRLANIEKAGYFPLPPSVTELILTYITAPHGGRILDPAAGEGIALVTLAQKLDLEPFGVELHAGRAEAAREAVNRLVTSRATAGEHTTRILHDSYLNLVTSRSGYNFLYLNPPYDHDDEDGRLEYQWLVRCRPWLQPGGLLVWVVPQHLLQFRRATRYILSWYDRVQVYRFPDETYGRFRQIVLFGVHRPKAVTPDAELVERLAQMAAEKDALPPLTAAPEPIYALPPLVVKPGVFHFRSQFVDPAAALAEAQRQGARTTAAWCEHLDPGSAGVALRPLTPLKIGHMNSIIAAGHLNNQVLADGDDRLLIKGRSYKVARAESFEEPLPDGRTRITHLETEVVVTDITTVDMRGQVTSYKGAALESFLQKWITHLAGIVAQDYPPVYRFDLNGYGELLKRLSKQRPIPGMNGKTGLLPAQKHAAAAALTRLDRHRDAILVGEMGVGKSSCSAAVAAGMNARRTIILCPPHLVDKWQREFKAVWPAVRTMHLQTVGDVDAFFADQPDNAPLVGVLKQTTARSASGWEHAYDYGGPAAHSYGSNGYADITRPWGPVLAARQLLDLPAEARPLRQAQGRLFTDKQIRAMQLRGIRCPVCGEIQFASGRPLDVAELKSATRRCSNEKCRSPLFQFTRRRSESQVRGSFQLYAARERAVRQALRAGAPLPLVSALPQDLFGYGKAPLAGYIKKRARGRLDLLIVDEVHQYKGIDSDQGYAAHHLAQAAEKVVALTGTIYGGKASSLFYLLFRLSPEMQATYVDPAESGQRRLRSRDWVSAYGILQRIETVTLDEDGRQTANSRSNVRYKELPGGSPAMLPWLLNRSVFLSLGDMGFPLPEYTEIPVSIPMAPEQATLYEMLRDQLKEELKERLVRGDKSLLAGYLYALLFWPDSPRRAKVVRCPRSGAVVASAPGLPADFTGPKETEIIRLCREEKATGRRVLLLCQQTDTLDIQPEWQQMLAAAGLRAAILRAAPNQREGWVEKQVKAGVDVIISHPKKVETGLDLLDFPTIIWMAIGYSVYTVLQASRRSWRIGQTRPVKVYYFAYEETIQEDALRLVAAKVAAALRVNGDTVGDDSLAELDELASGDLVATLARIVTGDVQVEARSLQQAFAEANASLRQANTLIGEYSIVEEGEEDEPAMVVTGNQALGRPLPLAAGNGHTTRQPSLFSGDQVEPDGAEASVSLNGKITQPEPAAPANEDRPKPPVPRPRLLIGQLGLK
ncbi:MAG: DUF6094 domain-containing protein [Chloroflexi bacterium]|nr:DUF6094 domain-containing protein [Chloroflexota bacterium]MCI0580261.1 DUF6094 domain-containing protein [Chloroflexota bacterium]MCI0649644.1 DUF6094 domain-containing protein [Chloroflexota bacterium]MCI0730362.1 DUF6094 domain-containing protein [Chloroflexota bacterium]